MSYKKRTPLRRKTDIKEITLRRVIPKNTFYCYIPIGWSEDRMSYKIKACPFYKSTLEDNITGYCKLMKCEIDDMCKWCGINE